MIKPRRGSRSSALRFSSLDSGCTTPAKPEVSLGAPASLALPSLVLTRRVSVIGPLLTARLDVLDQGAVVVFQLVHAVLHDVADAHDPSQPSLDNHRDV